IRCHEFKEDSQLDMARSKNGLIKWARRGPISYWSKIQREFQKGSGIKTFWTPFVYKLKRLGSPSVFSFR
ncbi:hypothetical protein ACWF7H_25575, partial [Peribacillus butanolivorans]|uniref:hypothetical protein n=1 Tax=Peribacillus butanolivorans TaxID=421767 RepID=UPI00368FD8CA